MLKQFILVCLFIGCLPLAANAAQVAPVLLGEQNLGVMQTGQVSRCVFSLTNSSNQTMTISAVRPLCECIQVISAPKSIAAGSQGQIAVTATPLRPGQFESGVEVEFVGNAIPRLFMIAGWVNGKEAYLRTNLLVKTSEFLHQTNLLTLPTFIDVRSPELFRLGHIQGSLNLPLFTIKGRAFLRQKSLVLLDEGYNDENLLDEAERLQSLGFANIRVLRDGFRGWQQLGAETEGQNITSSELATIAADRIQPVHLLPGWLLVNLGTEAGLRGWDPGMTTVSVASDMQTLPTNLAAALDQNPSTRRLLVANEAGANYEIVEATVRSATRVPIFYLGGGLRAYQQSLARELAMQNRKLVTISSQNATKYGPAGHPATGAGGCCGGR